MSMQHLKMSSCDLDVNTKSGCNNLATKRISKTASINSISKHQSATRFIVWYIIVIMAVSIMGTDAKPTHRHMNKHAVDEVYRPRQISKRSHPASNSPDDWNNPCGGKFDGSKPTTRMSTKNALHFLRKAARSAYNTLKSNEKQPIDIQDISTWDKHKLNYKFIPKLTRNSSTALKRWYRNVQTYVAGFSYLYNVQQTQDHKSEDGFGVSNELRLLMEQARSVLCEIETTINRTSAGQKVKFSPVSQIEMDKRLEFTTRLHPKNSKDVQMVHHVDLKYMKYYFMNFLYTMKNLLGKQNKKNNIQGSQSESDSRSVGSNEVNTSRSQSGGKKHRLAHNKRRQNKRTKQRIIQNNSLSSS